MYDFAFHRPSTVADAVKLLASKPDAKAIAGGHTLIPALKHRLNKPSDLIDISGISEMRGIRRDGQSIFVGALSRHVEVASHADIQAAIPALAQMAGEIGDIQVRNRGTIGGSVANNDPAADYPAAVLGLGAVVHTSRRTIQADDFFTGMFSTALEPDELIIGIAFPIPEKSGYAKMKNPASRYVMAGAFVSLNGGAVRVAINGAGPCVFRGTAFETALSGRWSPEAVAGIRQSPDGLNADIHGSAEYRAHLVSVMVKRAVAAAG